MHRLIFAGAVGLIIAVAGPAQPQAPSKDKDKAPQDPNRSRVAFQTVDFVELEGTYYRGSKGRDTPCVMLVHKFGSDRSKSGWDELAKMLQNEGFAVLSFDLRGHGGSINITPSFWQLPANRNGIIRADPKRQTTIQASSFKASYLPWLVNDLMAARRFLEGKNDSGELNASSMYVIGAQEGAALGMTYIASEWYRQYVIGFRALQSDGTRRIAGRNIAGAVWLSMPIRPAQPQPGFTLDVRNWIRNTTGMRDENPMCFIFGERDDQAKRDAEELFRLLTHVSPGGREKHKLDQKLEIKGTDLAGQAFLAPAAQGLGVPQLIVNYLKKLTTDRRAVPWSEMELGSNPATVVNLRPLGIPIQ
jgi:pimeloyl-ACP methyl ester carboxylesterase